MIATSATTLATVMPSEAAARWLVGGTLIILGVATIIGIVLRVRTTTDAGRRTVANLNARIRAWWVMAAVFALAIFFQRIGATILFAMIFFSPSARCSRSRPRAAAIITRCSGRFLC
jgi:phosphatidate cytidylyltransferase